MPSDKRKRSRVQALVNATVECSGQAVALTARNMSLKGMLCEQEKRLGACDRCLVRIELSEDVAFTIEAKVIRNTDQGLALEFTGMDEEAFYHLRRLVSLHAQDPDVIDKELSIPAFGGRKVR